MSIQLNTDPLVIVNQGSQTVWHPRRMDLALAKADDDDESGAVEGGTFRDPSPVREKRKPQPLAAVGLALLFGLGVPFAIAVGSELIHLVSMVLQR